MKCNICVSPASPLAVATVLEKYQVQYFRCDRCGFIQTEKPYWLPDAYAEAIARSDIGLIGRNIKLSSITAVMLSAFFNSRSRFLDYGGGNGMFVRLMRDKGFNFFWQDRYAKNQFAPGFEAEEGARYALATAFEVFEHLEDPLIEIQKMLSVADGILFSTTLIPANHPLPGTWWYYTLDTGQHISLYSKESLRELAKKFNLRLYSNGRSLHLLTKRRLPGILFFLLSISPLASFLWLFFSIGKRSLLEADYFQITGRKLK